MESSVLRALVHNVDFLRPFCGTYPPEVQEEVDETLVQRIEKILIENNLHANTIAAGEVKKLILNKELSFAPGQTARYCIGENNNDTPALGSMPEHWKQYLESKNKTG